jgi:NAD kinase
MSCGGGHLGFLTGIKNRKFVEDLPMIIPGQLNVSKRFFSETTWIIETKLPRNDHWKVL